MTPSDYEALANFLRWPTVIGILVAFIVALLSTRFYTVKHHNDVVSGLTEQLKVERERREAERVEKEFWRTYALRQDEKQVRVIEAQETQLAIIQALRPELKPPEPKG